MKLNDAISAAKNDGARAIGQVLRMICTHHAQARELIEQDLENKDMSLQSCFDALKAYAKKNQSGGFWGCMVAEYDEQNPVIAFVMDFYKIPRAAKTQTPGHEAEGQDFNLLDLL